ncbi:MAG: hypothetical protein R3B67_00425 [Phycisphaerales bacterium]
MSMLTIFLIAIGIAVLIAGAHFALILAIKPRKAQGDDVRHRDSKRE